MASDFAGAIPVLVVSGFLGSGKTTLIRRLLADPAVGETAVIVNEFGAVGIDHHLLTRSEERTTLLPNGCACCTRRDDLVDALRDLLDRRDRGRIPTFRRIILETTGLADPAPILQTLAAEPVLRHHYRLGRVVVTLDAVHGARTLASFGEAVRQVAAADDIVVTKHDLAAATAPLVALLTHLNPAATVHGGAAGDLDAAALLGDRVRRVAVAETSGHDGARATPFPLVHAGGAVASRCLTFERPLHWPMFAIWLTLLLHRHGDRLLRLKGLLDVGEGHGPLLVEGVQHVVHAPRHLSAWPDADRRSRLVVIARDLDPAAIADSLAAFQAAARRSEARP